MVCLKFELVYISLSLMDFRVIYYRAWVSFIWQRSHMSYYIWHNVRFVDTDKYAQCVFS